MQNNTARVYVIWTAATVEPTLFKCVAFGPYGSMLFLDIDVNVDERTSSMLLYCYLGLLLK